MMGTQTLAERVCAALDAETEGLREGSREGSAFDVHASSLRKHRLLLDLHHHRGAMTEEEARRLRDALTRNRTELAAQIEASRLVAELAVAVVRDDGSDGTYDADAAVVRAEP